MFRRIVPLLAALALLLSGTGQVLAAPILAIDFTSPTVDFTNGAWSLGFRFTVGNSPIIVNSLGFYDDAKNGLTQSHSVGIFSDSGTLLASTTVTNSDPLVGYFRYSNIPDLLLSANTTYRIAATTGSENYTWNPTGFTVDPRITFVEDRFTFSSTLVFPASGPNGVQGFFGPNFQIAPPAPEPTSLAVFGLVTLAAGAYGWRRRKQAVTA